MSWNVLLGILSTVAMFVPAAIIIIKRMYCHKSLIALLIYYIFAVFYNFLLTEHFITLDHEMVRKAGVIIHLFDTPLMLSFLLFFSATAILAKRIKIFIAAFILFELIIIATFNFTKEAVTYIMGPGILLIVLLSLIFLFRQIRLTIMHRKSMGKVFMIASVLFYYFSFCIIYLFYYLLKTIYVADTFLVYFVVTIFSSFLMSAGLLIEKERILKLSELKTTRKELSIVFGNNEKAAHERAAWWKNRNVLLKAIFIFYNQL
jgi:hypothetical protein